MKCITPTPARVLTPSQERDASRSVSPKMKSGEAKEHRAPECENRDETEGFAALLCTPLCIKMLLMEKGKPESKAGINPITY